MVGETGHCPSTAACALWRRRPHVARAFPTFPSPLCIASSSSATAHWACGPRATTGTADMQARARNKGSGAAKRRVPTHNYLRVRIAHISTQLTEVSWPVADQKRCPGAVPSYQGALAIDRRPPRTTAVTSVALDVAIGHRSGRSTARPPHPFLRRRSTPRPRTATTAPARRTAHRDEQATWCNAVPGRSTRRPQPT